MSDHVHQQDLLEIALQYRRSWRHVRLNDTVVYLRGFYANMKLTVLVAQKTRVFVRPASEDFSFPLDLEDVYHYDDFLVAQHAVRERREMIERMLTPT